ncbi:hypothetical protein BOX15_Mlig034373g1, partial [Macrostomum lignano]
DLVEETVDVALSEYICRCLSGGQIRVLSLRQCRISDDSLAFVLTNLAYSKVATLNLTLGTIDSSKKIKQLTKYLPKSRVTNLSLHGSPLTSRHLQQLLPSLLALPTLASLDLGDCNLTDDCAAALSRHLLSSSTSGMSTSLACLALSGNADISSSGWCRIFLAIGRLPGLRDLRLDFTRLGDEGVRQLAILLTGGTCSLRCLDLDSCGITDDGAATLIFLLENFSTSVGRISLAENEQISQQSLGAIASLLAAQRARHRVAEGVEETDFEDNDDDGEENGLGASDDWTVVSDLGASGATAVDEMPSFRG